MAGKQWDKVAAAYQLLVEVAVNESTIHYKCISDQLGGSAKAVDGIYLVPIFKCCKAKDLPNLVSLVVIKGTDNPGRGWASRQTVRGDREKVYDYPWKDHPPPSVEELRSCGSH